MLRKLFILAITCLSGWGILYLLLSVGLAQSNYAGQTTQPGFDEARLITPTIQSVLPNVVQNNIQSEITISGANFEIVISGTKVLTAPQVWLNGSQLIVNSGIPTGVLTTVIPCGYEAEVYSLTVVNPSGGVAWEEKAITITQYAGSWTNGGPYGGSISQIVFSSENITTVYAIAPEAGLFVSTDTGKLWHHLFPIYIGGGPLIKNQNFTLKPGDPDTMVLGNEQGLYSSNDAGQFWQTVLTGNITALSYSPVIPNKLYVAINGQIRTSTDDGATWGNPGQDLPRMAYPSIAVHPYSDTIAYAGSADGHIYKTIDGGETWNVLNTSDFPQEFVAVYLDPIDPEHIYATSGYFGSIFHRSMDGGLTWEAMSTPDSKPTNDFVFPLEESEVIYGMNCWGLYISYDDGETWTHPMGNMPDCMSTITLHPDTGKLFLAGGGYLGVWKCEQEDCDWYVGSWHTSSEGIRALIPGRIAAAESSPWQAYTSASAAGGYFTEKAGQQWVKAIVSPTLMLGNHMTSVAVDPNDPCIAYLGSVDAPIYRTMDCGKNWSTFELGVIPDLHQEVNAIAVDPHDPNIVYAGGIRFPIEGDYYLGMVFSSTNRGQSWNEINFGHDISPVSSIEFDSQVTGTLYIATGGRVGWLLRHGDIYKSIDAGRHWQNYETGLPGLPISVLAIDTADHLRLYAGICADQPESYHPLYTSTDGGVTWQTLGTGLENICVSDIFINPLEPSEMYLSALYHVTPQSSGVYRSLDRGNTWESMDIDYFQGNAYCLGGGVCNSGKTPLLSLYACVVNLPSFNGKLGTGFNTTSANEVIYGSGVFQKTIIATHPRLYLPLILQNR